MNQNSGFINLFHFYKNKHSSGLQGLQNQKHGTVVHWRIKHWELKKEKTEWSSLHFPLLGADVKDCGDRGEKEKGIITFTEN